MSPVLTVITSILGAIVASLTIGRIIMGSIERYSKPVFREDVMTALEGNPGRYKEFHEKVFAGELDRGRRAADIVAGVQHDLKTHMDEFSRFRAAYEGHQEMLVMIPKTVVHLDESVKRLDRTLADLGETIGGVREDVAYLKGRAL